MHPDQVHAVSRSLGARDRSATEVSFRSCFKDYTLSRWRKAIYGSSAVSHVSSSFVQMIECYSSVLASKAEFR